MGWVFLLFLVCFSFQQKVKKKIKRDEISVQNCLLKKSTYCPLDAEFFSYNCFILSEKDYFLPCSLSIYECRALYLKSVASSYFLFSWFLSFSLIPHKKQQGMLLVSLCRFSSSQLKDTHRTKCTNHSPSANLVPRAPLFCVRPPQSLAPGVRKKRPW